MQSQGRATTVGGTRDEEVHVATSRDIILEVRRIGRRPRYHRGYEQAGERLDRPQCNIDQAGAGVERLQYLPEGLPRPWAQLCRRCWAGSKVLAYALALEPEARELARQKREERKAYRALLAERKAAREAEVVAP